jgi:glycosyltransferase involved in cell wall biosynthesis
MIESEKNRVLILVPGKEARGGITNYYSVLEPLFTLPVTYFERGSRKWPIRKNLLYEFFRILNDYRKFFQILRKNQFDLVQTSTSFSSFAIFRDAVFIVIAKLFKCKVIVFFRGRDEKFVLKVEKYGLWLFKAVYFKTNAFIDLSKESMERFKVWGYNKPIFLETTIVANELLQKISEEYLYKKYSKNKSYLFTILYLARIEISKGIYEAIETFRLLQSKYPNIKMIIAGDGREEIMVRKFAEINNIKNISFLGFVDGDIKRAVFMDSDYYLFPSYFEGMPNSVLEAIAFGLPIISTNVGGLSDFFINGTFGYITDKRDPDILAEMVEKLIKNPEVTMKISLNNYNYAKENFLSTKVVKRIESIFCSVINS